MKITTNNGRLELGFKQWLFPGGEIGIQLNEESIKSTYFWRDGVYITARIQNSNDLFTLALMRDAILRVKKVPIHLILPYIPYGRQDKAHNPGESLSLKVFADYLNFLNFESVTTFDCHSEVTNAVINNLKEVKRLDILKNLIYDRENELYKLLLNKQCLLISPDVGANKKIHDIAAHFGHDHFIRADKLRELQTGKIIETIVYVDDLNYQTVVILDDIADGARTFIELAKVLKKKNAGRIILYVTHGIFSKGYKDILEVIDEVYTTNSFQELPYPYPQDKIHVIKVA